MRHKAVWASIAVFATVGIIAAHITGVVSANRTPKSTQSEFLYSFAAMGDIDTTPMAIDSLNTINQKKPAFTLALGDLSYGSLDEYSWCNFITSKVGVFHPFQLIAGNHDIELQGKMNHPAGQGHIDRFATCLPNRMPGMKGLYGHQYYFDKENTRFVMISPDLIINKKHYTYAPGSQERKWLEEAIAGAEDKRWIVVGMHKNCISFGKQQCEIGEELFNYLVEQKVTLILQGHDHTYQRSHQLAHGKKCDSITPATFNKNCIVERPNNRYSQTDGTLLLINGTGGSPSDPLFHERPTKGYFTKAYGFHDDPHYGPVIFRVYDNKIVANYIDKNGVSADRFEIIAE